LGPRISEEIVYFGNEKLGNLRKHFIDSCIIYLCAYCLLIKLQKQREGFARKVKGNLEFEKYLRFVRIGRKILEFISLCSAAPKTIRSSDLNILVFVFKTSSFDFRKLFNSKF
jgi:hypothetical protein